MHPSSGQENGLSTSGRSLEVSFVCVSFFDAFALSILGLLLHSVNFSTISCLAF